MKSRPTVDCSVTSFSILQMHLPDSYRTGGVNYAALMGEADCIRINPKEDQPKPHCQYHKNQASKYAIRNTEKAL